MKSLTQKIIVGISGYELHRKHNARHSLAGIFQQLVLNDTPGSVLALDKLYG